MSRNFLWKVNEGDKVRLKNYDPAYIAKNVDSESATTEMEKLGKELNALQELMAAAQQHSLLIVLQGMDTSGKDGTIRHVMSNVNPQGCAVHSFKAPTAEELAHDFLWRVHNVTPRRGMMGIFNRSHYEDVLVVRVHDLVPETVWSKRYKEINHFEKLLTQNGTIILKFFLYISADEQAARLKARMEEKDKAWKISASDFAERSYWDAYQEAYEAALSACSTDEAPWHIVPANHKWYRNLAVAETLVKTMRKHKEEWLQELEQRGKQELAEIQRLRDAGKLKGI
jgi:polyphosphate:nucleotide phosphotransferase, PPK2 family